jgi:hypothetical protein
VGRSTKAEIFTDAQLLTNLENIGAKDIYRHQSTDGSVDVYVVFDSEISYRNAVTKSVWMHNTNLAFVPQTQMSSTHQVNNNNKYTKHSNSSSSSARSHYSSYITNDNTYAALDDIIELDENVATATNCTPLGQGRISRSNRSVSPMSNRPQRS